MRRPVVLAVLVLLIGSALASAAHAATRRALLVGINEYAGGAGSESRWTDLRGSRNDVEAMRAILVSRFGFAASDVRVLTDGAATRDAILAGLRDQLVEPAQPGDVSVFFYAGHGSQVRNPDSSERDGLDETIVPADSNRGAPDIPTALPWPRAMATVARSPAPARPAAARATCRPPRAAGPPSRLGPTTRGRPPSSAAP